jgi:cyclic pyranopterin phosphate synthase
MAADTLTLATSRDTRKGDPIAIAELAGIMAAKKTADLIPLCHPLPLTSVKVDIEPIAGESAVSVTARAKTSGQTGVEMEALTAVSVACLTLYDMLKAVDKAMVIGGIELVEKTGGKSGDYRKGEP